MKKRLMIFAGIALLLAALSASDADLVRNLEFFESMDAMAAEDQATLEKMADDQTDDEAITEEDDEN